MNYLDLQRKPDCKAEREGFTRAPPQGALSTDFRSHLVHGHSIESLREVILACTPTRNAPAGVSFFDVYMGCPRQLLLLLLKRLLFVFYLLHQCSRARLSLPCDAHPFLFLTDLFVRYKKTPRCGAFLYLAEREGFEPSKGFLHPYSLSRGAPSATRPPLQKLSLF